MKRSCVILGLLGVTFLSSYWFYFKRPEPTILSVRVGQTFEEVIQDSTFPVLESSNPPAEQENGAGAIWVTEPSVIIRFSDPQHGFVLPPTKFAGVRFDENRVASIETSPMLEKLPFSETVKVMQNLQEQFRAGGWRPWIYGDGKWFDFSPEGQKQLYAILVGGRSEQITLVVPEKRYEVMFRVKCAKNCYDEGGRRLFLIDLSIGTEISN